MSLSMKYTHENKYILYACLSAYFKWESNSSTLTSFFL